MQSQPYRGKQGHAPCKTGWTDSSKTKAGFSIAALRYSQLSKTAVKKQVSPSTATKYTQQRRLKGASLLD